MGIKLDGHTEGLATIKEDIQLIKQELKSKEDRDKFNVLEKRVMILEKKVAKV